LTEAVGAPRVTDMSTRGTGILICGMHRSGTSALGGALHACGVVMRENMPADHFNPKGYFEKVEVMDIHEEFFRQFGMSGVSVEALPVDWQEGEAAQRARLRIGELVENEFAQESLWAIKDPRLCRLVPLWRSALSDDALRPVLVVRHPLEVVGSLHYLSGYTTSRGLLFWLRYVLEAERNTRGMKRSVVRYEDLLASPLVVLARLEKELELRFPDSEVRAEKLKNWIDAKLNRNAEKRRFQPEKETAALVDLCLEVYGLFDPASFDRNRDRLDAVWAGCFGLMDEHFSAYARDCSLESAQKIDRLEETAARLRSEGPLVDSTSDVKKAGWVLRGNGDINGDGRPELIFQYDTLIGYLTLDESGVATTWRRIGEMGAGWHLRAVVDLDGDGRPELVFQNGTLVGALQLGPHCLPTNWKGIGTVDPGWAICGAEDGARNPEDNARLVMQRESELGSWEIDRDMQPAKWHGMGTVNPR